MTFATDEPWISADSHITEPPETYVDHIDARWKDRAPRMRYLDKVGDVFVIDGIDQYLPMSLVSAAGKAPSDIRARGARFDELHRGGWDPKARLADHAREGVVAEVLYPSVGMVLCGHPDFDYKAACFAAYNRWLSQFCAYDPSRYVGCGQLALRSVADGIRELESIHALGLRGVMMPGDPGEADYDHRMYDPFWERAVELGLPLGFHILTDRANALGTTTRGPKLNGFLSVIRGCQDILGMLILGGVFERHPKLRVVCVEADAGWVPHYLYRMDHAYERHRHWLPAGAKLSRRPSEYFHEHVYLTFQDDWTALRQLDTLDARRLLWANDFPHADSTWPTSRQRLAPHLQTVTEAQQRALFHDNVAALYGLSER